MLQVFTTGRRAPPLLVKVDVADDAWFTGLPKPYPDAWWPSTDWNWVLETAYFEAHPRYSDGTPPVGDCFEGFSSYKVSCYGVLEKRNVTVNELQARYFIGGRTLDKRDNAIRDFIRKKATSWLKSCASDPTRPFKADDREAIVSAIPQVAQAESRQVAVVSVQATAWARTD